MYFCLSVPLSAIRSGLTGGGCAFRLLDDDRKFSTDDGLVLVLVFVGVPLWQKSVDWQSLHAPSSVWMATGYALIPPLSTIAKRCLPAVRIPLHGNMPTDIFYGRVDLIGTGLQLQRILQLVSPSWMMNGVSRCATALRCAP